MLKFKATIEKGMVGISAGICVKAGQTRGFTAKEVKEHKSLLERLVKRGKLQVIEDDSATKKVTKKVAKKATKKKASKKASKKTSKKTTKKATKKATKSEDPKIIEIREQVAKLHSEYEAEGTTAERKKEIEAEVRDLKAKAEKIRAEK